MGRRLVVVLFVAALAFVVSLLGQHSTFYEAVESDRSWLAYLPAEGDDLELAPVGLNSENATGNWMRRVDLMDGGRDEVVSLCFAASRKAVLNACPGSIYLGRATRPELDLRAMSHVGKTRPSRDWLALLSSPTPRFEDVAWLDG
jgi:hypothetical protein